MKGSVFTLTLLVERYVSSLAGHARIVAFVTSTSGGVKSSVFDVEPSDEVPSTLTLMI
jgi:hypothetical protein